MAVKQTSLELVYPPVSNQEAVWLTEVKEVQTVLRGSDFYMIVAREEARFEDFEPDEEAGTLCFSFVVGSRLRDRVLLRLDDLIPAGSEGESYWLELGPKLM